MPSQYRTNLSWLVLGRRITKVDALHGKIAPKARAAAARGMKWRAYRTVEEDKHGHRRPWGQWLWIPKAGVVGHLELPPSGGTFVGGERYALRWRKAHPLARSAREVFDQLAQWTGAGEWRRTRKGRRAFEHPAPTYDHWLEAREAAEREGRKILPYRQWRDEVSEAWHWRWYQAGGERRREAGTAVNPRRWRTPGYSGPALRYFTLWDRRRQLFSAATGKRVEWPKGTVRFLAYLKGGEQAVFESSPSHGERGYRVAWYRGKTGRWRRTRRSLTS